MNFQRPFFVVLAAAILMLVPVWMSAADEVKAIAFSADAAVIAVEVSSDGDAGGTVVVEVEATAAGQAFTIQTGGRGIGAYSVREEVDPQDAVERFALLLPGGPMIVEATMTIEGEPFRVRREALIDEMLAAGDVDEDGIVTWDEALGSPRFTYGRVIQEQQRARYLETLDLDEDGEVDRSEARGFLAMFFQGPSFTVAGGGYAGRGRGGAVISVNGQLVGAGGGQADVSGLLDMDSDGIISESEMAEAGERLKSRDADDNDLLYAAEIGSGAAGTGTRSLQLNVSGQRQRQGQAQQVILLGPTTTAETLFNAIRNRYQTEEGIVGPNSFSAVSALFEELDSNNDETLSQSEVMSLNAVTPHARLTVDVGIDGGESSLVLTELFGEELNPDGAETPVSIELPGATVAFAASSGQSRTANFDMAAQRMLAQYDGDNNEYLERSELPENFATQFDNWDVDQDGKVFQEEIAESYTRAQAPQQTQVQARISQSGDPLFPALDLSGDSRLSLREMRTAAVQLAALDRDGDGKLTQTEVPIAYAVNFGVGNSGYAYGQVITAVGGFAQTGATTQADGPSWFVRMDRNGDGDVTLREFLGGRESFEALDTNGDGFIEPAEAEAASETEGDEN